MSQGESPNDRLSEEEAKLLIKSIEDIEREEASSKPADKRGEEAK